MTIFRKIPALAPAVEEWLVVIVNPWARAPEERFLVVAHASDVVAAQHKGADLVRNNPAKSLMGNPIMYLAQIRLIIEPEKQEARP